MNRFSLQRFGKRHLILPGWIAGLTLLIRFAISADLPPEQVEFFESKIRPILAQDCYECHNSQDKAKGGLVLDHREAWKKGGDSGAVIEPGNPAGSLLLKAIRHQIEDLKMPKAGAKLESEVIADFEKWIAMGAPDPRGEPPSAEQLAADTDWNAIRERRKSWWSFQPIVKPEVPGIEGVEHPVDRLIRAKLEETGLPAAKPADPRVLLRRLYFNLIGLPPGPEKLAEFLEQYGKDRDAAVENVVDELLASPAFGEKWARHWMDWTRYADTHGSEGDPAVPNAYLYRDYLIRALNDDVSYDRMLLEHFAGDLLEDPRINEDLGLNESALGIGHLRMVFHGFAPTDALDELVRFTDDQINTTTKAFLGLTVSCARCHHHKFDPISQDDFYALFGIFRSSRPAMIAADAPGKLDRNRDQLAELKPQIRSALVDDWKASPASGFKDPQRIAGAEKPSALLHPLHRLQKEGTDPESFTKTWESLRQAHENDRAAREAHRNREYAMRWVAGSKEDYSNWFREGEGLAETPSRAGEFSLAFEGEKALLGIYPSGVYSHGISMKHRAVLASPPIDLDGKYDLWVRAAGDGQATVRYAVQNYPRSGTVYPVPDLKDGQWEWKKFERLDYWDGDRIHIEVATAADQPLLAKLGNQRSWFGVREAVLMKKGSPKPPADPREYFDPVFEAIGESPNSIEDIVAGYRQALQSAIDAWKAGSLTDGQALFLDHCLKVGLLPNAVADLKNAGPLISQYRQLEAEIPVPTRAPGVLETRGYNQPLFERGDHKKPVDPVPRRFLEAIDATPYETELSGRLEFAGDLLREDNPLTRRVIVNRVWHHLFGKGLVASADNFGRLGEPPSHPKLLDLLAVRFSDEHEWSLKALIRDLVLTDTWRQSSDPASAEVEQIDPDNRLLSHANVRRLEAEAIRDSLLALAGNLDLEDRLGPSVPGNVNRRSVYVRSIRNNMDPFLTLFDAPVPASTVGRRNATNVPAQSLTLLNDPFVISQANAFAGQVVRDLSDAAEEEVIDGLFARALARSATATEIEKAESFLAALARNHANIQSEIDDLEARVRESHRERATILDPVRERLLAERKADLKGEAPDAVDLKPIASWDFELDLADQIGDLDGEFRGTGEGKLEGGALVVGPDSIVATRPLERDLGEKTLEVVVQIDTLDQRGGGVMTVQDLQGGAFDSIVFAEKKPKRWLAGSNNHARTLEFGGTDENEAAKKPVHLALVYQADGHIVAYRNGEPYGQPIRKREGHTFKAGESQVLFGLRHGLRPSDNRVLSGRIFEARLYDRALTQEEIAASAKGDPLYVSQREVIEALSKSDLSRKEELDRTIETLQEKLDRKREQASGSPVESRKWRDLAHAIFNLKEFIYIR